MVKIALKVNATLENIEELRPSGHQFRWYLKFTCSSCGEVSEKWNYASLSEFTPALRGNAVTHFMSKCKLCSRENSMSILEDSLKPYVADNQEKFQTIVVFDCRGLEPIDFSPREGWIAKAANGGKEFTEVDLSEGEWADYCDKIKEPVGIYDIEHRFERVK
ncbi:CXXC motif containing zinc binding protein [Hylaeus anthracinus]|uniref:CXXC motif containing zinc binding protein n=1 Tax=Hylaeus volcanicus TaxID=313075 RepID=UPI0023B81465|nr:CXXC motif containing zinc binding protein [Hylaeus volcanicus]XP_054015330.1 CXXC motif containing zinc binding protein [Hylaeus anthracinus]